MRRTIKFHRKLSKLITLRLKEPINHVDRRLLFMVRDQLEERLDFLLDLENKGMTIPIVYV